MQAHGAIVVFDLETEAAVQISANVEAFLGSTPEACLAQRAATFLPAAAYQALRPCFEDPRALVDRPRLVYSGPLGPATHAHDIVAHVRSGWLVVEMEPHPEAHVGDCTLDSLRNVLRQLETPRSLHHYCLRLASCVREMTGYDRVLVYQFDSDRSIHPYAEATRAGLPPSLNPPHLAAHVSSRARGSFMLQRVRQLPDTRPRGAVMLPELLPDDRPLDMTYCFLRGTSRARAAHLESIGVRATLTVSLARGERPWGVIMCHHHGAPHRVSHATRVACEVVARAAAPRLSELSANERRGSLEDLESRREQAMNELGSLDEARRRMAFEARLIGVVGHDLRTPLGAIGAGLEVLRLEPGLSPRGQQVLHRLERSTSHMTAIVRQVLNMTGLRRGGAFSIAALPCDVHAIAEERVEELRIFHRTRLIRLVQSGDGRGTYDATALGQVLVNLVDNALAHGAPNSPVDVRVTGTAHAITLAVTNRGEPLPEGERDLLFEPFKRSRQANRPGLGLGLYIAKGIADAHNAAIEVCSSEHATTFSLVLPRS